MIIFNNTWELGFPKLSLAALLLANGIQAALPKGYNVVWNTPSVDSLDSMPLSGRLGEDNSITITLVKARQIRLNVLKACGPININEFQVFTPPVTPTSQQLLVLALGPNACVGCCGTN